MSNRDQFLQQLQIQAKKQAVLHEQRLIPHQLDGLTALVGNYPWQILLLLSGLSALVLRFL